MLHFITAIFPEAEAVIRFFSLKRRTGGPVPSSLTLYGNQDSTVFLLVTGAGKLAAATAVTEYLALLSSGQFPGPQDEAPDSWYDSSYFCSLGICGCSDASRLGELFLCSGVIDLSSGHALYPELYATPFSEALLATAEQPVSGTAPAPASLVGASLYQAFLEQTRLPLLFDMEGYGVFYALTRKVMPSRCFLAKVVSDALEFSKLTPEQVTELIFSHLAELSRYFSALAAGDGSREPDISGEINALCALLPFSATMKHRLTHLLSYARLTSIDYEAAAAGELSRLSARKNPSADGFTKREAGLFLDFLEQYLLSPASAPDHSAADQTQDTLLPDSSAADSIPKMLPDSSAADSTKKNQLPAGPVKKLRLFSRIYVETEVLSHPVTRQLLARYPKASVIPIRHYKDIFNRSRQNLALQETEPSFILAANHAARFYPGAPVCQSFGEEHFYYTSCIMNCIYDCDYCYLQGMYPSGNIVVFVNTEDYFAELDALLLRHPVYLCCSYDSDLTALNGLFPHAEQFCRYAAAHPSLRLELRTKCSSPDFLKKLPAAPNIIMAFTVSPQPLIEKYEHFTPSLAARLVSARLAARLGFSLRLCIDPILDVPNAVQLYKEMLDTVFTVLSPSDITDISLGVFRISKDYLKQLRAAKPDCAFSHYPYTVTGGVCHYRTETAETLLDSITTALLSHGLSGDQLFYWKPDTAGQTE